MKGIKYFMLSHQSLMLYRDLMKLISKIPDHNTQNEIKVQVKNDYMRYRDIEDLEKAKGMLNRKINNLKKEKAISSAAINSTIGEARVFVEPPSRLR